MLPETTSASALLSTTVTDLPLSDDVNVVVLFLSAKSNSIRVVRMETMLSFNHGSNHFLKSAHTVIESIRYTLGSATSFNLAQKGGDYVYIESHASSVRLMYHIPSDVVFVPLNIPNQESYEFFQRNGDYYLLQSDALIKLTCFTTSC